MTGRIWQVVIATVLGVALLVGLGAWQLQRLAWKEALIAEREQRLSAAPVSLDAALKEFDADRSVEFLKVKAQGAFQYDAELFVLTTEGGVPGFQVVTPLASTEGVVVLVDRGFIPEPLKDAKRRPDSQPAGDIEVTGLLRRHVQGRGAFTPDNDTVGNIWYWWDIPAMLAFAHVAPDQRVAPFVLHIEPDPKAGKTLPSPVATDENLTNNHLQYALTWFSLAVLMIVMSGLLIRQMRSKGD